MISARPIGPNDAIHVKGKHLFKTDGSPFVVKGIAFPTVEDKLLVSAHGYGYNATAWLDVLRQLRELDLEFNTIRLYRMFPEHVDYDEFFEGAASMGVYVIIPLTSSKGKGVLDRNLAAPKCYGRKLFRYGAHALKSYLKHSNVLAGMVGNEVMNDEKAWHAAPCIRAYSRDLKLFMDKLVADEVFTRTLPLIYAAQDSSVVGGAATDKDTVVKLTVDYLTCVEEGNGDVVVPDVGGGEPIRGILNFEDDKFGESPIDIFGVNIESWCSSTQKFLYNSDGTPGTYYSLWSALRNSSVPIIFTEMGCPHSQFDRDDEERKTAEGTRDWKQVPFVLNEMADSWSGFIAYAYDGPKDFVMFGGGEWNGTNVLTPTKDFDNFRNELKKVALPNATKSGKIKYIEDERERLKKESFLPRQCSEIESELLDLNVKLFNDDMIRSYSDTVDSHFHNVGMDNNVWFVAAVSVAIGATLALYTRNRLSGWKKSGDSQPLQNGSSSNSNYMSIAQPN